MHKVKHHKHRATNVVKRGRHRISRVRRFHTRLMTMHYSRIGVFGGILWAALSAPTSTSHTVTGVAYICMAVLLTAALVILTVHLRTLTHKSMRHVYRPTVIVCGRINHTFGAVRRVWDNGIVVHKHPGYATRKGQRNLQPVQPVV